jgi:hypothetical protein
MKQVVDHLVVGVEHVSRSKEVHWLDIACVRCDIPKDLTLSVEERHHPLTPHLVVFAMNPDPGTPSLDLRLVRVNQDP